MKKLLSALAALSLLVTPSLAHHGLVHQGCATGQVFSVGAISVAGAYSRAMLPGAKVGGGYLEITNAADMPDRLIGAASEAAGAIGLHQMTMAGDMMKMAAVAGGIEIPAKGGVSLTPQGYHLMMTAVGTPFKQGECVEVTLSFERAGPLDVLLNIGTVGQDGAPEMGDAAMPDMDASGMDAPGMEMDGTEMPAAN